MEKLTLGKKIRLLREMKELKQDYMAEKLDMTVNGYGKIERDESDLSFTRMNQIAKLLEISVPELVNLEKQQIGYTFTINNENIETLQNIANIGTYTDNGISKRIDKLEQDLDLLKSTLQLISNSCARMGESFKPIYPQDRVFFCR